VYSYRSETETRQLNQVIKQLREVRKVSKEDVDSVTADRDELRARLTALETEFEQ
jgi:hypothetical protein